MKKIIALLLAAIMLVSLTSCYTSYKPNEKDEYLPDAKDDRFIPSTNEFNKPDIEHEKASLPEQNKNQDVPTQDNQQLVITDPREKALLIALGKADVLRENAYDIDVERDYDLGVEYWEVDFKSAGYEYDVKIKADTMEIVIFNKEIDD